MENRDPEVGKFFASRLMATSGDGSFYHPSVGGAPGKVRLDMNEYHFPISDRCLGALRDLTEDDLRYYNSRTASHLQAELARLLGTHPDRLFFNHGEAEIIKQIFMPVARCRGTAVLCRPSWPYYSSLCSQLNIPAVEIPLTEREDEFAFPTESLKSLSAQNPALLVLNSPHMPTGAVVSYETIREVASRLPETLIVLDEAYWGYDRQYRLNGAGLHEMLTEHPNVVIARTMSKFFGLAGLRVGFGWCHERTAAMLDAYRPLFGLSAPANACALAALTEYSHYERHSLVAEQQRDRLHRELNEGGAFLAYRSRANFLLVKCLRASAAEVARSLAADGFLVRPCEAYGLKHHIRISIGDVHTMDAVIRTLSRVPLARESNGTE